MNSYSVLIFLSLLVIISYVFNLFARSWKLPAVLLLLGLGILLRYVGIYFGFEINNIQPYLELFGIVGLILIVLEASLDLKVNRFSIPIVTKSFEVAFLVLVLGFIGIACLLHFWLVVGWRVASINSIPLAVISSAIVIPSVAHLSHKKKEFLIYESTLSDILGILLFNFLIHHEIASFNSAVNFIGILMITILVSVISSLFLLYLIAKIKDHVKIFIILSVMILLYSLGKLLHLSPLLLIFVFGVLLSNYEHFFRNRFAFIRNLSLETEFSEFKLVVAESSFVIRTFFFVMFGYSINLSMIANREVLLIGSAVVFILVFVRYIYLKYFARIDIFPELFIAPKGLVSILLFYSIPVQSVIPSVSRGVLFYVIFVSSILMAAALFVDHRKSVKEFV
ncbi:MAG: cation:proton antiporter [Candidatus Omnitrophica bacterium]|nr:cation:proton antiporter [Candidatus Omnitrophota bacterium]